MSIALEADHMVASVSLLSSGIAGWTRLGMCFHVVLGGPFFGRELELAAGKAGKVFSMPTCFADFAEGERAVFADRKTFSWWR